MCKPPLVKYKRTEGSIFRDHDWVKLGPNKNLDLEHQNWKVTEGLYIQEN